ncbi:MAG: AraC family transcriptional regulator [Clostridia bacterium]|nr:AraC family transcriptional regulator [Clostridia bacterium]
MVLSPCNCTVDAQGRELLEHGTPLFPIACYQDDLRQDPVPWHWHEEMEVAVVAHGQILVAAGEAKYRLREGEGFFINANVLHGVWALSPNSPCQLHSLVFHPRLVGGSRDSVFYSKYLQPLMADPAMSSLGLTAEADWHKVCLAAIETAWQNVFHEPAGYEFAVREALSRLIYPLSQRSTPQPQATSPRQARSSARIKAMLRFIHAHYAQPLNTAQIAASALVSPSECLRCFHQTIGMTPMQYVKQYRIQQAAALLSATPLPVTEIGFACGFQEMSYFAKVFRELKGCTPTAYRQKNSP